jgi:hypothetical protein
VVIINVRDGITLLRNTFNKMWWIHLLVRRVDRLRERAAVLERVVRAVGTDQYTKRVAPLLLLFTRSRNHVRIEAVNGFINIKDRVIPSQAHPSGSLFWWSGTKDGMDVFASVSHPWSGIGPEDLCRLRQEAWDRWKKKK